MAGRTHGQHAVPITFGLKAASWTDELQRVEERLRRAELSLTGQLGGAAGTLASLGEDAAAVQSAFCRRLGLGEPAVTWHSARDRIRDLGHALAEAAAAGERIAAEVVSLQATELAEVAEPLADGHVGSSTMPQKRNPMVCEYVVATARLLRGAVGVLTGGPAHLHERDMGAWAAEWIALPQALILAGGLAAKLAAVLEGLVVYPERMRLNLELSRGQIMAEAVMMVLARELGHERAHELVARAAVRATAAEMDFAAALLEDPDIAARLGPERIAEVLDPASYLGLAAAVAGSVAARTTEVA
jgi:3-carboxy-cis,cis-muconate cycloisomerase